MRFKGLDLNLLVALASLLETRSVSATAKAMNLSQQAVSAALARPRVYFSDDLLVVNGKRMYPTAYAEALSTLLKDCLRDLDALLSSSSVFDPATAQRTFVIVGSDYVTAAVLTPLTVRLAREAPGVRLEIFHPNDDSAAQLAEGKIDLLLTPAGYNHPDHPADLLYEERHVVAGWSGNPLLKRRKITEADIFSSGHVAVTIGGRNRAVAFADRQLALMGKVRRIEVVTSSFTAVPWLLKDTLRLSFMHERLARAIGEDFPLAYAPIPFKFPLMPEMVQYHQARAGDEGLVWLRKQLSRGNR
jgi:LysR family transcriptional regulator, nod-box dependent transcriptional activator